MLERTLRKDRAEVTFILPADNPPGPVSGVGDFNDWQPGTHTFQPRKDDKRAVTVELPPEEDALTIRHVTERLMEAPPQLDADLVESSVQTAYEELRYARVRTYLPILIERRAKDLLGSDGQTERGT
ncbi:three-helix bundle dimerization domain-containing protein [Streptomyces nojiriensis]|uniref:three-helix bundle dimerization domain-containing protein n=1 Tax=Streptomyces nojiriensis TaxID=66374 RepID=UPI003654462F